MTAEQYKNNLANYAINGWPEWSADPASPANYCKASAPRCGFS